MICQNITQDNHVLAFTVQGVCNITKAVNKLLNSSHLFFLTVSLFYIAFTLSPLPLLIPIGTSWKSHNGEFSSLCTFSLLVAIPTDANLFQYGLLPGLEEVRGWISHLTYWHPMAFSLSTIHSTGGRWNTLTWITVASTILQLYTIYSSCCIGKTANLIKDHWHPGHPSPPLHSPVGQKMQKLESTHNEIQEQLLSSWYQTTKQSSHKLRV